MSSTAIVWYRRDLRVHDHPALCAALKQADAVVPFFCFDDRLLHGRHESGPRTQFLLECLADLRDALRLRGSDLVLRHGPPERELARVAKEVGAGAVHITPDVSPFATRRDGRVRRVLAGGGVALNAHPGLNAVHDVTAVCTNDGRPYTVFSPFHRRWVKEPRREPLEAPDEIPALPSRLGAGTLPAIGDLGLASHLEQALPGGEQVGRECLAIFLEEVVHEYESNRDALGQNKTSRLSPYLRFGCISPREVESRLPQGASAAEFRRQLAWRDFYYHVLHHFPRNAKSEFQRRYRGRIRWSYARKRFDAWRKAAPAIHWSTQACGSFSARAGCTTAPGWWSARS